MKGENTRGECLLTGSFFLSFSHFASGDLGSKQRSSRGRPLQVRATVITLTKTQQGQDIYFEFLSEWCFSTFGCFFTSNKYFLSRTGVFSTILARTFIHLMFIQEGPEWPCIADSQSRGQFTCLKIFFCGNASKDYYYLIASSQHLHWFCSVHTIAIV
jgi:hypothetical protein